MLIGFVQGYEELKWGIRKLNPLCNGPIETILHGDGTRLSLLPCTPSSVLGEISIFLQILQKPDPLFCILMRSDDSNGTSVHETTLILGCVSVCACVCWVLGVRAGNQFIDCYT